MGGSPQRVTCGYACMRAHRRKAEVRCRAGVRERHPEVASSYRCHRCHETLPAEAFQRNRTLASGLQGCCKQCRREYDAQPERQVKDRLRKHVWYLLHWEEVQRHQRQRLLFDREYRARVNAENLARYHVDPQGNIARRKELRHERRALEAADLRRCFCGKALPADNDDRWFCQALCKLKCSRFVCGLDPPHVHSV